MNINCKSGLRLLMTSTVTLAFTISSVVAQRTGVQGSMERRICGDFEYVEVNGEIVSRQILENCESRIESVGSSSRSDSSNAIGLAVGGLALAGIAAGGGGGGSSAPAPAPTPPAPAPMPEPDPDPDPMPEPDPDPMPKPDPDPILVPIVPIRDSKEQDPPPGVIPSPPAIPNPDSPEVPQSIHQRRSPLAPPTNKDSADSWHIEEFHYQYGLGLIGAEHRYANGATGTNTLGVIYDTGIKLDHPDVGGIRLDSSYNYVDSANSADLSDADGHGTAIYGVVGATRNGYGIHGVAPDAEFMILKTAETELFNNFTDALKRTTNAEADAMNNSWNSPNLDIGPLIRRSGQILATLGPEMINELRRAELAGVSIVFPTGNSATAEDRVNSQFWANLPAALPELEDNWIAVTALNDAASLEHSALWVEITDGTPGMGANQCGAIAMDWCIAAPGENIISLGIGNIPSELYVTNSGTSLAAAHVTGAILLLKSQHPEMTTAGIHELLFETAHDLGVTGTDPVFGRGALDLREAMAPQGVVSTQLGEIVNQATIPLSESWFSESSITGGVLGKALSDRDILVTDRYDRGYFADLGSRVTTGSFNEVEAQTGLAVAFSRANESWPDLAESGFDLRFDAFGSDHDVTRIAHADPIMSLVSQTKGTGFSMEFPVGKTTLSMAQATTDDRSALSLGAGLPFGDDHSITVSLGQAKETDSILGARAYGAFAGLDSNTVYGRVQTDIALGEHVALNGSLTAGQTSFSSDRLIARGKTDTRAIALGLTVNNALTRGDKLSVALSQPFAVSGGELTLKNGTGISAAENNVRTNRISFAETIVPLGKADRAPELHLGYLHDFETRRWDSAGLAFGGVANLDGGARVAAARVELRLGF